MAKKTFTLKKLAKKLKVEFLGNENLQINHVCGLESLKPGGLAYLSSPGGINNVPTPRGMSRQIEVNFDEKNIGQVALIVSPDVNLPNYNLLICNDPLAAHVEATKILNPTELKITGFTTNSSIHPSSVISKGVKLGKNVFVGPKVVIYDGVQIGENTILHSGVVIMSNVIVGSDCIFFPNVVIHDKSEIGDRVILSSGAVIGSDGHGYFQRDGINYKIPQIGNVNIEDDVEIGACTTIDRARFETTIIKKGSKIDNQVQIAHNVSLGDQSLISAQSAIGGSVKTGSHLILGGQSGIRDHVNIGNNVTVVARAVITSNTSDKAVIGGMPGRPVTQWRKLQSLINRLAELFERVRKLEERLGNK